MHKSKYLATVFALLVIFSVVTITSIAAQISPEDTVVPNTNCMNHDYSVHLGSSSGFHTYLCSNQDCLSSMTEECYNDLFCINYQNSDVKYCLKCGVTPFENIHNYQAVKYYGWDKESSYKRKI